MENPCQWCVNTSSLIDSIDYEKELLEKQIEELKQKLKDQENEK